MKVEIIGSLRLDNSRLEHCQNLWMPNLLKESWRTSESHDQAKILILVGGEEKTWTFGKGATLPSTYGQLCKLATENGNT